MIEMYKNLDGSVGKEDEYGCLNELDNTFVVHILNEYEKTIYDMRNELLEVYRKCRTLGGFE